MVAPIIMSGWKILPLNLIFLFPILWILFILISILRFGSLSYFCIVVASPEPLHKRWFHWQRPITKGFSDKYSPSCCKLLKQKLAFEFYTKKHKHFKHQHPPPKCWGHSYMHILIMLGERHESPSDNFSMKVGDKPDIRPNKMAGIELHLASLYSF